MARPPQGRFKDALVYRCPREHVATYAVTPNPAKTVPCQTCAADRARKLRFNKPDPGVIVMTLEPGLRRVPALANLLGAPAPRRGLGTGVIEA